MPKPKQLTNELGIEEDRGKEIAKAVFSQIVSPDNEFESDIMKWIAKQDYTPAEAVFATHSLKSLNR